MELTIEQELEIVENNINEYGVCDVTLREWNALKDGAYADGVLAGIELGKAEMADKVEEILKRYTQVLKRYIQMQNAYESVFKTSIVLLEEDIANILKELKGGNNGTE